MNGVNFEVDELKGFGILNVVKKEGRGKAFFFNSPMTAIH